MQDQEDDFEQAFDGFGEDKPTEDNKEGVQDANKSDAADNAKGVAGANDKESGAVPSNSDADKGEEKPEDAGVGDSVPESVAGEPEAPEATQPLTKADIESVVSNLLNTERSSSKELEATTSEVLEAYYPEGLSNVLVDESSGKELRTPQDVVEASGGQMTIEEAAQWLMNEQFKLDRQISEIKDNAKTIAETTVNFKRESTQALEKYEPLFQAYPHLQKKVFERLMKLVKADTEKGVILSSPDVMEFYDDYLEPYQQAFEYGRQQPATNPITPPPAPEPPKPTAEDRMDIGGDGGASEVNDPNDFAQQVSKELAKGI